MNSGLQVLQLGKYYHPYRGGIETHLQQLCEGLLGRVAVEALVCHTQLRTTHESVNGVPVTRCGAVAQVASTSLCPAMGLELAKRSYDLIHIHFPHPMGVAAYIASPKPRGHRLVVTYHSDIVKQARLLRLYRPLMKHILERADAIICTSEAYAQTSVDLASFRYKCRTIPYGVDPVMTTDSPRVRAKAEEIRSRFQSPLVLAVGRLVYYKGFEVLVRAMARVKGTLLIIGGGPLRRELERLAHQEGVADRVHFLGEFGGPELVPFYRAADVFALPSVARSEAFAIVQLEAMASGVPVVNTSLDSGVPWVSLHGKTGLTVPPSDVLALAEALNTLLSDPALRARMGEAGKVRVRDEFSAETMIRRVLDLYESVTSGALASQAAAPGFPSQERERRVG